MIRVCFAAGCYGHFLAQCLYFFTNLRSGPQQDLNFDDNGSSHDLRQNADARSKIRLGHRSHQATKYFDDTLKAGPDDSIITILTCSNHWLDYMNNQYSKKHRHDLAGYLDDLVSSQEMKHKLTMFWDCDQDMIHAPLWMQRELFSFIIFEMLRSGYEKDHCGFDCARLISTKDFFQDFVDRFGDLAHDLGLSVNVKPEDIVRNHRRFVKAQIYHGSQQRCQDWVDQVLRDESARCPAMTFFDEAYIQHLLRDRGWEIQCHGLDQFPQTADQMRELIYRS